MTHHQHKVCDRAKLDLSNEQLSNYTLCGERDCFPDVGEVKGRGEGVQEPERQHRWDPPYSQISFHPERSKKEQ